MSRDARAVLGPLLRSRGLTLGLAAICVAQVALVALGLPGWLCPVRTLTGVPCPGCGLSRAVIALLGGRWGRAVEMHAFAPIALASLLLVGVAGVLPERRREALASAVTRVEARTGVSVWLGLAFVLYWLFRLLYTRPTLNPPG